MRRIVIFAALLALSLPAVISAASATAVGRVAATGCSVRAGLVAPATAQEAAMLCLVNGARRARGLPELVADDALARAADRKSADILRCDEFSHEACGREFTYWIERFGFHGCAAAENIAWGGGSLGGMRSIFRLWMHSSGHRENILGPYEEIGIGLRVGSLEGNGGAHVWTQDFGGDC
ncbi:MAG TPA: CAP domain-containing protein [Solirubrobacterales bacterium]|jgi:uncharacterized protein YkwD|nr:CAP domain-containing protein [Solirubrobacterales bacterium]